MPLTFLITGAARGIGRGLARGLVAKGHRVHLADADREELEHTVHLLATHKDAVSWTLCDLAQHDQIQQLYEEVKGAFDSRLDCLINNAADTSSVGAVYLSEEAAIEQWQRSLAVNLTAPWLLSRKCLPLMRKGAPDRGRLQGGCIINMSSTRAHQSEPRSEPYAATKAGLIGFTHALAASHTDIGVRVNAILPGWIHVANECKKADLEGTKWEDGLTPDDHRWHFSGRVGRVDDILRAVEYLAEADFVTGTELVVDGGVTRKMVYPEE